MHNLDAKARQGDVNVARRWMIELRKLVTQENPVSRSVRELV